MTKQDKAKKEGQGIILGILLGLCFWAMIFGLWYLLELLDTLAWISVSALVTFLTSPFGA